jgi:hypothetical protein
MSAFGFTMFSNKKVTPSTSRAESGLLTQLLLPTSSMAQFAFVLSLKTKRTVADVDAGNPRSPQLHMLSFVLRIPHLFTIAF